MRGYIKRLDHLLGCCERTLAVVLFAALVLLIVFNIVARNLLYLSFQRTLELAPALVLWLALIGSTLALKYQRHIRLELLLRFLPPTARTAAGVTCGLFGAGVMGILFYASCGFVYNEIAIFGTRGWMSVIFPLFFALACFRYLAAVILGRFGGERNVPEAPER